MTPQETSHRILVNLARQIRSGKIQDREKLISGIINECLPETNRNEKIRRQVEKHLEYLLQEEKKDLPPLVHMIEGICGHCSPKEQPCTHICPTGAITCDTGEQRIDHNLCVECGRCIDACISGAIVGRSEFAQVAAMLLQSHEHPVYAILAPSFVGQFGPEVTPEIFKSALASLGFKEIYEVALAADVTTMFEAEEFSRRMETGEKFMITSCCCPAFIKFIEKIRPKVANLLSPTVSPMIAMGKMLKLREPQCRVVFIGPCIAKKNEAKRPDLQPAIDCVITFKETRALLEAAEIKLDGSLGQMEIKDASHDGRIYAHTGGVTEAIVRAVQKIKPGLTLQPVTGNGLKQCGDLLKNLEEGKLEANFMEGMGCPGGCVGGPGTIIKVEEAARHVDLFAKRAPVLEASANASAIRWMEDYYRDADVMSKKINMGAETKGEEYPHQSGEYFS